RSKRSAMTPPMSENRMIGIARESPFRPTWSGEWVSSKICQRLAVVWSWPPTPEVTVERNSSRKARCSRATNPRVRPDLATYRALWGTEFTTETRRRGGPASKKRLKRAHGEGERETHRGGASASRYSVSPCLSGEAAAYARA